MLPHSLSFLSQKERRQRLKSFSDFNWEYTLTKDAHPTHCAQKGWRCVGDTLLACDSCREQLVHFIPDKASGDTIKKLNTLFAQKLAEKHAPHCDWKMYFAKGLSEPFRANTDFLAEYREILSSWESSSDGFKEVSSNLGLKISHAAFVFLKREFPHIISQSAKIRDFCEKKNVFEVLALFGWKRCRNGLSRKGGDFKVKCHFCQNSGIVSSQLIAKNIPKTPKNPKNVAIAKNVSDFFCKESRRNINIFDAENHSFFGFKEKETSLNFLPKSFSWRPKAASFRKTKKAKKQLKKSKSPKAISSFCFVKSHFAFCPLLGDIEGTGRIGLIAVLNGIEAFDGLGVLDKTRLLQKQTDAILNGTF